MNALPSETADDRAGDPNGEAALLSLITRPMAKSIATAKPPSVRVLVHAGVAVSTTV